MVMSIYDNFTHEEVGILRERAERAAQASQDETTVGLISVLEVHITNEIYALPISELTAIYDSIIVIPIPCVPAYITGVANIRGQILSVLDLAMLLGGERDADTDGALIVVTNRNASVALRAETIGDTVTINTDELTATPATIGSDQSQYIQGILPDGTSLLNISMILNNQALIVDEQVQVT